MGAGSMSAIIAAVGLFLGMLACAEAGRRYGLRRMAQNPTRSHVGLGVVDTAVFAVFGLLIAFTFSGAATRFDERRAQIVQEANDIGTAYMRLDDLAPEARDALQAIFRRYLESRVAIYEKLPDLDAALKELARSNEIQQEIWRAAVAATRDPGAGRSAPMLVLPAINQMFDMALTRTMAARAHPPFLIFAMLYLLGLVCAAVVGHALAVTNPPPWGHLVAFALVTSVIVYTMLELEYPRLGFIQLDSHDRVLVDLLRTMN